MPSILSTQNTQIESCQKTNANGIKYETDLYYPNSPSYNFRTIPFESEHYKYGQRKFWLDPLYQLRGNSNEIYQIFFFLSFESFLFTGPLELVKNWGRQGGRGVNHLK